MREIFLNAFSCSSPCRQNADALMSSAADPARMTREMSSRRMKQQLARSVLREWRSRDEGGVDHHVETFMAHLKKKNRRHSKLARDLERFEKL